MTTEWKDLPTMQDVACAQDDGWEVEISMGSLPWVAWGGKSWDSICEYRGRPRQPKMKEVKMECFVIDRELRWHDEGLSILSDWIRQPHLDMTVKVPE